MLAVRNKYSPFHSIGEFLWKLGEADWSNHGMKRHKGTFQYLIEVRNEF